MNQDLLSRTLGSVQDVIEGVESGLYTVWGGVVRITKGHEGAGQIVGHLQFPGNSAQAKEAIERLQQALGQKLDGLQGGVDAIQDSLRSLQSLQVANLALTGLNLAVSVAGFMIVCKKLNGISNQLKSQSEKLDTLINLALEQKAREEIREAVKLTALLKTIEQFARRGDCEQMKRQIPCLHEQYEYTKATLMFAASNFCNASSFSAWEILRALQERMMHLALLQCFVNQQLGDQEFSIKALTDLKCDWLEINTKIVDSIAANQHWIDELSEESSDNIVQLLEFRQQVLPAIEYQESMLAYVGSNSDTIHQLDYNEPEIRLLVA